MTNMEMSNLEKICYAIILVVCIIATVYTWTGV